MSSASLREKAEKELSDAGFGAATLEREMYDEDQFGNAEAVFSIGSLRLRFLRDRGQEFLELGSLAEPGRFFLVDDVEVAMGWKAVEDVLTKQHPDDLRDVVARVGAKRKELEHAFSLSNWPNSARCLESAAKMRGELFLRRLQQMAKRT
jgi:hypothetical protein